MSEVQQRLSPSPRGRGSPRGSRGGNAFGTRSAGARSSRNSNGDTNVPYSIDDQSEMGQLKKQYSVQLVRLREMFLDWSTENLLTTLQENNGDLETTATKISEGLTTQWDEVKNKKLDRSRSKVKEPSSTAMNNDIYGSRGARAGRGGVDARAGGRGRGGSAVTESRSGRPARGRGGASTNGGARQSRDLTEESAAAATWEITTKAEAESKPADGDGWDNEPEPNEAGGDASAVSIQSGWGDVAKATPDKITPKNSIIKPGVITSWANILKSTPLPPVIVQKKPSSPKQMSPPPVPQPQVVPEPKEPEPVVETLPAPEEITPEPQIEPATPEPEEPITTLPAVEPELEPEAEPETLIVPEVKEIVPTPSQQPLTEVNLEKIEDTAPPAPTTTQASTIASSVPPLSASSSVAPPPPQPTVTTPRAAHAGVVMPKGTPRMYSRRVLDQQEGVVMPSNHGAVEHATLQFGSMGLSGDLDDEDEVEQAETVSQPPQPSPIAQPVTALPPTGPAQLPVSQAPVTEPLPIPRQAPGLPAHPQAAPQQPSQQPPLAPQNMTQQHQHMSNQYNRYGNPDSQQPQAKTFETFGAPVQQQHSVPQPQSQSTQPQLTQSQQHAYAGYAPAQLPHQQSSHIGVGVSTTPDQQQQYSNYYDRTQPPGFGNVYNTSYMQQGQSQQDAGANQQRASSGLGGAGEALGQIPTSAPGPGQVQQPTSRYGAAQSGEQSSNHGTPSPAVSTIQQTSQPHNPAIQQYPGGIPGYGYQHPYYNQFMHQNYYNHPSPFGKHQGMYAYPQQAYMSPQYSDHSSTPAGLGGFGTPSTQGRESVGLGDYGRMNATASQQQQSLPQHTSAGAYGGTIPNFLNSRGLPEQQQLGSGVAQQQAAQQGQNDESMKFENKPPTGPSSTPSIAGQPGRPGSATSGANLGPQHGAQTPASMYGSHLNHNLHGQQAQHSQQYGVGQGQSSASQYSMYTGGYPQYGQSSGRHTGTGWGGYGQH